MIVATPKGGVAVRTSPFNAAHGPTNLWQGPGNMPLVGLDIRTTYAGLYRTQPWLQAVINKLSRGIGRLPLKAYTGEDSPEARERLRNEGIARPLRAPYPQGSRFSLVEWTVADAALFGNALWVPVRTEIGAPPTELWPAPWPRMEVIGEDRPEGYVYHGPNGAIPFDRDEVVHFRFWGPSPTGELVGVPPVESLRRALMNEDAAQRWTTALFQNAGRPSGIVTSEKPLKDEKDRAMVRRELQELYGGVDKAFRIAVLGGMKWETISLSAVDAALIELRKLNREEVAGAYDIPPSMLHILDRATHSNIEEQHRMQYMDSFGPWFTMIEETISTQLIDQVPQWHGQFVEFDVDEVHRGNLKERAEGYKILRHFMTIDELRKLEKLSPIGPPLGELILVPGNEVPVSQAGAMFGKSADLLTSLLGAFDRVERSAASRVGAGKAHGFDPDRFAGDLDRDVELPRITANAIASALKTYLDEATNPAEVKDAMDRIRREWPTIGGN
jgi:HK97 family phage portal protein